MRFGCRSESATWDDDDRRWTLVGDDGRSFRARFVLTAVGVRVLDFMPKDEPAAPTPGAIAEAA